MGSSWQSRVDANSTSRLARWSTWCRRSVAGGASARHGTSRCRARPRRMRCRL